MTVAELIELLQKQNPKHIVYDDNSDEIMSVLEEGNDVILSTNEPDEDEED